MSTFGTFTIIKNEARWISKHLLSWLCFVDQMVFFDGNSTDGTLEIIKDIQSSHPFGKRIALFEGRDCNDLAEDYVRLNDAALHALTTDYAMFAHPDMILEDKGKIGDLGSEHAYFTTMRSFAGELDGQLFEIKTGRADRWKNIYRLRNPDLGLHYWGNYGAWNEDCYFSKITGSQHDFHGDKFERYPYAVGDSGIKVLHFSDVRLLERRIDRMTKCLINQGHAKEAAQEIAKTHPRVTFENKLGFEFAPVEMKDLMREVVNV